MHGKPQTIIDGIHNANQAFQRIVRALYVALQDSNPERRNLLLMSLSFIAFFLGGGSFPKDEVRLQIITISFSRPEVLAVILWIIFIWFLYRYWVVHRYSFVDEYRIEINGFRDKGFVRKFIEKSIGRSLAPQVAERKNSEIGLLVEWLRWRDGCLKAFVSEKTINRGEFGVIQGQGPKEGGLRETISFNGSIGWLVAVRLSLQCIIERPSFSNYIAPYIFASIAILLSIIECAL